MDDARDGMEAAPKGGAFVCKTKIGTTTESGVLAAIKVLEDEFGMTSEEFERQYATGELDHLFIFNHWDHLLDLLRMLREEGERESIVAQTRDLVAMVGR